MKMNKGERQESLFIVLNACEKALKISFYSEFQGFNFGGMDGSRN